MRSQKNLTRKRNKIPPSVAEQGVNVLEFLIEAGGARKTKKISEETIEWSWFTDSAYSLRFSLATSYSLQNTGMMEPSLSVALMLSRHAVEPFVWTMLTSDNSTSEQK